MTIYTIGMLFTLGFLLNLPDSQFDGSDAKHTWSFAVFFLCAVLLWPVTLGVMVSGYMFHGDGPGDDSAQKDENG